MPGKPIPALEHTDPPIQNDIQYSRFSYKVDRVIYDHFSKYQQIQVYETAGLGRILVLDGVTQLAESDEYVYHEMLTHVPSLYHPMPTRTMVIGGGDGCTLREVEKYKQVKIITQCEIDKEVIQTAKKYFATTNKNSYNDKRLNLHIGPAEQYIKTMKKKSMDVIICDSTEYNPNEPVSELLYGESFYTSIYDVLDENGIFTTLGINITPGKQYKNNFNMQALDTILHRMGKIFDSTVVHYFPAHSYAWTYMCMFVGFKGKNPLPSLTELTKRYKTHKLKTKYYTPLVHAATLIDPKKDFRSIYPMSE